MTTPLMGSLLVILSVKAYTYEPKDTTPMKIKVKRKVVKITPSIVLAKEIRIKFLECLICITDFLLTPYFISMSFELMPVNRPI